MDARRPPTALATGLVVALFAVTALGGAVAAGVAPVAVVALAVVAGVVTAGLAYRGDAADGGSVWEAIPAWQYVGRHVESGGLARDEQERSLEELEERAARLEEE